MAGSDLGERFHVFCLDLRNHGQSPHAVPHSYDAMKVDVLEWMDCRGIDSCLLMGHSMGGKLAMKIACDSTDRVQSLIVVDIAPKSYPNSHDSEYEAMKALDLETLSSRRDADRQLELSVPDWGKRQFLLTNLVRSESGNGFRWAANIDALEENQREIEASPVRSGDRYEGETLFLLGERSRYVVEEDVPLIREMFPRAIIDTIPESGHNPHFESKSAFVSRVANFLQSSHKPE